MITVEPVIEGGDYTGVIKITFGPDADTRCETMSRPSGGTHDIESAGLLFGIGGTQGGRFGSGGMITIRSGMAQPIQNVQKRRADSYRSRVSG